MGKSPADEQEPHTRPTGGGELAQHSEARSFDPGGKCGGQAAEVSALTWGDLSGFAPRICAERPTQRCVG